MVVAMINLVGNKAKSGPVERLPLDPTSPWWGEHRSRYCFAQRFVAHKRVLDIACGSGLGCSLLVSAGAQSLVGVDVTLQGIFSAVLDPLGRFVQASGTALPFADGSFDVVTSFETIEHI